MELRDGDEQVKAATETNELGLFPQFAAGLIEPGDSIVVFGGYWRGQPFVGEFRLLMTAPDQLQVISPVTTLVSAVAGADFIAGETPAERLDAAVAWMIGLYMIDADWNTSNPSRTEISHQAVEAATGIQNWVSALLPHIEAGEVPDEWMSQFPATNAGVLELVGFGDNFFWLPEDTGQSSLSRG